MRLGEGPGTRSPENLLFSPMPKRFSGQKTQLLNLIPAGGRHLLWGREQHGLLLVGPEPQFGTVVHGCGPRCLSDSHNAKPSGSSLLLAFHGPTYSVHPKGAQFQSLVFNWTLPGSAHSSVSSVSCKASCKQLRLGPGLPGKSSFPEASRVQFDPGVGRSEMTRMGSAMSSTSLWSWARTSSVSASS